MLKNFTFYSDESGHTQDPTLLYTGLAGFIAPAGEWIVFEERWQALMKNAGFLEPFHMIDFVHSNRQFECWKPPKDNPKKFEPERQRFLGALVNVILETKPTPIAAVVSQKDFETLTTSQKKAFRDPYYLAFQVCTKGAAIHVQFEHPEEKVAMVYSRNEERGATEGGSAEQLWYLHKNNFPLGKRMGAYSSSTPAEINALQAVDLLAYEICHEFENLAERPQLPMRWPLLQLLTLVNPAVPMIRLFDRAKLLRQIKEGRCPDQTGTEGIPPNQYEIAMGRMDQWMYERAGVRVLTN